MPPSPLVRSSVLKAHIAHSTPSPGGSQAAATAQAQYQFLLFSVLSLVLALATLAVGYLQYRKRYHAIVMPSDRGMIPLEPIQRREEEIGTSAGDQDTDTGQIERCSEIEQAEPAHVNSIQNEEIAAIPPAGL